MSLRSELMMKHLQLAEVLGKNNTADTGVGNSSNSNNSIVRDDSVYDWSLNDCCNQQQIITASLIASFSVIILLLWGTIVMRPFKLSAVLLHEFGHATACWLSGGVVTGIEVNLDEGGVTKTIGGNRLFILISGYLGSSFWGMIMIIASSDLIATQVVAGFLCFLFVVILFLFTSNWTIRFVILFILSIFAGFWACTILTTFNGLSYMLLFFGVMNCLFAIYDIWDDLISRRVNESDASVFAALTHTSSRCWGVIWALISILFLCIAVYLALVLESK